MTIAEPEAAIRGSVKGRVRLRGALRQAYVTGYSDGLAEADKRLSCALRANAQLWQEILRLDDDHPVGGASITLPHQFAESLLAALAEPGPHQAYRKLLAHYVDHANENTRQLVAKLQAAVED